MTNQKRTKSAKSQTSGRRAWKKKTPVEVVLAQAEKLREEIAQDEALLEEKRTQLEKFEQARKIFEAD